MWDIWFQTLDLIQIHVIRKQVGVRHLAQGRQGWLWATGTEPSDFLPGATLSTLAATQTRAKGVTTVTQFTAPLP